MNEVVSNEKLPQNVTFDQLKQILDHSYDGILVTDASGTIIYGTPSTSFYMGIDPNALLGKNVKDLVEEGVYDHSIALKAIELGEQQSGVVVVAGKEKVFSTATPYFDKQGDLTMVITNVRTENILEKYIQELNQEKTKNTRYRSALSYLNRLNSESKKIIAESPEMIRILKYLDKISKTDSTVLLLGESGSGKEVLSKYIHEKSNRCSEPLIPVNCAAIPKDLLESEFYGYDKGAFTGALTTGKAGFFEMADRGTLFLDEIGELPIEMQSKLLRSIELGEFKRIGGTSVIRTDVRIIAATNQSLEAMVERKEFRRDLFYRLNVIPINIPPLRERKEDIIELAKMFLEMYLSENDSEILLNSQLINYLLSYDWPGNIRELKNVIERIAIDYNVEDQPAQHLRHFTEVSSHQSSNIKDQDLDEVDLRLKVKPYELSEEQPIQSLKIYMHQIEKNYLLFALDKCHWNIAETAKLLGIHRSLLYRKLAALDLHKDK